MTIRSNDWWCQATQADMLAEVRRFLDTQPPHRALTTVLLVERVYPEATARGGGINARKALFRLLMRRAEIDLAGYFTRSPEITTSFGRKRPYVWHAFDPTCPRCNGTGKLPALTRTSTATDS